MSEQNQETMQTLQEMFSAGNQTTAEGLLTLYCTMNQVHPEMVPEGTARAMEMVAFQVAQRINDARAEAGDDVAVLRAFYESQIITYEIEQLLAMGQVLTDVLDIPKVDPMKMN